MENKDKLVFALKIAILSSFTVAISLALTMKFLRDRKRKQKQCYLRTESKPQNNFKRILADNSYSQFKHLRPQIHSELDEEELFNLHPYKAEISKLLKNPNFESLEFYNAEDGVPERGDSYVWVETESQLEELVEVLSKERVFAVDTEQHSLRSFLGFTALVQISTRMKDYLLDTIALHDVMGILRPIFSNPRICKVFHGADNDVLWLQRDFHIYVVNLFDTAKACDVLLKPQRSLAYLLETYCSVATNKLLQREDWRRRPLPYEMVHYARADAHYLLYIAQCLLSELKLQKSGIHASENSCSGDKFHFLLEASRRSNATCLQLYTKDTEAYPGESAASSIVFRFSNDHGSSPPNSCDPKFQDIVSRLCAWRDVMARIHDESLRFVLSEHAIAALAGKILETELDICSIISKADQEVELMTPTPLQPPSPVVCSHLGDISYLLQDNIGELDDLFPLIIQRNLGQDGGCPLSAYNYGLLSKSCLRRITRPGLNQNGFRATKKVVKKASRELFVQKFSCKAPVYHNCKIYANDGRLLCYCDHKKLEWYLKRNLAKLVEDDPPAIMLLFEPKGRPEDEGNDFYIQSKKNICVGCGEGNHYLRYRVIPSCYRIHFPEHLKSHRSHDIVLLCVNCHEIAHAAAEKHKKQIAAEFGIPLFIRKVVDSEQAQNTLVPSASTMNFEEAGVSPLQLRIAAMALVRHGSRMPSQRREELMQIVMNYYGGREVSEEDLKRALLAGMSPQERRRFAKKNGLALENWTLDVNTNSQSDDNIGGKTSTSSNASNSELPNLLDTNGEEASTEERYVDISMRNTSLPADVETNHVASAVGYHGVDSDIKEASEIESGICEHESTPEQSHAAVSRVDDRSDSSKHETKYSLLGHGPHGKQVVEKLVKEHGEDGIRQFCQRWRQVFVDAVHPRFLPTGWDVNHSGKRDFGDFSVYNPTKRVSATAAGV